MAHLESLSVRWCPQVRDFGLQALISLRSLRALSIAGKWLESRSFCLVQSAVLSLSHLVSLTVIITINITFTFSLSLTQAVHTSPSLGCLFSCECSNWKSLSWQTAPQPIKTWSSIWRKIYLKRAASSDEFTSNWHLIQRKKRCLKPANTPVMFYSLRAIAICIKMTFNCVCHLCEDRNSNTNIENQSPENSRCLLLTRY